MKLFKLTLTFYLLSYLISCSAQQPQKNLQKAPLLPVFARACGDFLSQLEKKPAGVRFNQCTFYSDGQGKPFKAIYQLSGADAARIEQYLIRQFKVTKLHFLCCYWEPRNSAFETNDYYRDPKTNIEYYIRMTSEETLITMRQDWAKIGYFYIVVTTYTEEI